MTAFDDWNSPAWLTGVTDWLDATLAAAGRHRTGPVELTRVRPWGTVLRAPSTAGRVWLKAPAPSLRFEIPLLAALAGLGLDGVPEVLGTDRARGVLLLDDLRPRFLDAAAELAGSRIPPAVDHNDVHHGNLADDGGLLTVLDWGDAVVAHPFAVLLFAEQKLLDLLGGAAGPLAAARRASLAPFADLAPGEDLGRTADLAVVGAQIGRAWVWQRALDTFADAPSFDPPPGWPADFARGPLKHLRQLRQALAGSPE